MTDEDHPSSTAHGQETHAARDRARQPGQTRSHHSTLRAISASRVVLPQPAPANSPTRWPSPRGQQPVDGPYPCWQSATDARPLSGQGGFAYNCIGLSTRPPGKAPPSPPAMIRPNPSSTCPQQIIADANLMHSPQAFNGRSCALIPSRLAKALRVASC